MERYRVVGTYTAYGPNGNKRVFHAADVHHAGPSVTLQAYHRGERPPAPVAARVAATPPASARFLTDRGVPTCVTSAEFARLREQVERQVASQRARRAALTGLECRHCHWVSCRCGVPAAPDTMQEVLRIQQARRAAGGKG